MGNHSCCQSHIADNKKIVHHVQDYEHLCGDEDGALLFEINEFLLSSEEFLQKKSVSRDLDAGSCPSLSDSSHPMNLATTSASNPTRMESASLMLLAQCLSPLLVEIGKFLADRPQNMVPTFVLSARWLAAEASFYMEDLWEQMYSARWPAFHDAFRFNRDRTWCSLYEAMIYSRCSCHLEVFEREKKIGFDMAAMPALVSYHGDTDTYVAKYISASEVDAEIIPCHENYRLRFCPISAHEQLRPFFTYVGVGRPRGKNNERCSNWMNSISGLLGKSARRGHSNTPRDDLPLRTTDLPGTCVPRQVAIEVQHNILVDRNTYPYKVLGGFDNLIIGRHVELQWKMQEMSPFGWWFGRLESLQQEPNSKSAIATITFAHFPEHSSWHRLKVRFGDGKVRPCSFGGFSGGVRAVSDPEKERWMRFLPKAIQHVAELHR